MIRMFLGSGKLELESSRDPSEAFPLRELHGVSVSYRGEVVLTGRFAN